MSMYKEEEKSRNKQVDTHIESCRDLNTKLAFEHESTDSQVKLFYSDTLQRNLVLENELQRVESIGKAQQESVSTALAYMTEFLNIQNCIDIKISTEAAKHHSNAFIKEVDEFQSPQNQNKLDINNDIEVQSPRLTQANHIAQTEEQDSDDLDKNEAFNKS